MLILIPARSRAGETTTAQIQRLAGVHFGPINAVEEKVKELDNKANKYWIGLWEDNGCTGDQSSYSCSGSKPNFPQKVLNYWAQHPGDRPDSFGMSVTSSSSSAENQNDTVGSEKTAVGNWPVGTAGAISAAPAYVEGNSLYVSSNDGNLYALSDTGTKKWQFSTEGEIDASPAINSDGKIFFGNQLGRFYALSNEGDSLWTRSTGEWIISSAAISQFNSIFVGNTGGELYSFTTAGETNWVKQLEGKITGSPVIGNSSHLYIGTWKHKLYALDATGGTTEWTFTSGDKIKSSPALRSDSMIYLTSLDGYLYALKDLGDTYQLDWKTRLGDSITTAPAIGSDSDIYVGCWDGKLYSLTADGGTVNWTFQTSKQITSSPAVGSNGNIYFGSANGNFYGVDKNGNGLWKLETENTISSAAALANNKIYFGSNDNNIYATTIDATGLYPSDWPKYRGVNRNYASLHDPIPQVNTGPEWYVNDTSTSGDIYTTARGDDANSGGITDPFRTLDRALAAAETGETIYVDAGTYRDTAIIRKNNLGLIGAGPDSTVFDYNDSSLATGALALRADTPVNLTLKKLGFKNYYRGLKFSNLQNLSLNDISVENCGGAGLHLSNLSQFTLKNSTVNNNDTGIYLSNGNTVEITNLTTDYNNSSGFRVVNSSYLNLNNLQAQHNGSSGLKLLNSDTVTITQSLLANNDTGLVSDSSANLSIVGIDFTDNSQAGAFLSEVDSASVVTSLFEANQTGLLSSKTTRLRVDSSTAKANTNGIKFLQTDHGKVSRSTAVNNTGGGFLVKNSLDNRITNNVFKGNGTYGVKFSDNTDNYVAVNSFLHNNQYQIYYNSSSGGDSIIRNNIRPADANPDSGVYDLTGGQILVRNWWDTSDRAEIAGRISGSNNFIPFRLNEIDTAVGADTVAPATVQVDTALGRSYRVIVRWENVTSDADGSELDFNKYRIYRTTSDTVTDWISKASLVGTNSTVMDTEFIDHSIDNGETYYYRITAVDTETPENESFFSDTVVAYPQHLGPVWYVNDTATTNDVYTTKIGSDSNTGGATDPFRTVSKALEVAVTGETIHVDAGTYGETVSINSDNLSLIGADSTPQGTIIDPPGNEKYTAIVGNSVNDIAIEKLRIRDADQGIILSSVDNSTLYNNTINSIDNHGIRLENNSNSNDISNNVVNSAHINYVLSSSTNNTFISNVSQHGVNDGFQLNNSYQNSFNNNSVINNGRFGIYLANHSDTNTLTQNNFAGNLGFGIKSDSSLANVFQSNSITNNSGGLSLIESENTRLTFNSVYKNSDTGIEFTGSPGAIVYQNEIKENEYYQLALSGNSGNFYFRANNFDTDPAKVNQGLVHSTINNNINLEWNWWGITNINTIKNNLAGSNSNKLDTKPFRLGKADTTGGDTIIPKDPTWINFEVHNFEVGLDWGSVGNNQDGSNIGDLEKYRVYRSDIANQLDWKYGDSTGIVASPDNNKDAYTDTEVLNGDTYYYRLTAVDDKSPENESWYSDTRVAGIPPIHIYGETYVTRFDSITIQDTLGPAMPGDSVHFIVNGNPGGTTVVETDTGVPSETGWADTYVSLSDTTNTIKAKIYDKVYGVLYDSALSVVYYDTQPPDTPSLLSPTNGTETTAIPVDLTWEKPADTFVTDKLSDTYLTYRLQIDTEANFDTPLVSDSENISGTSISSQLPASGETLYWRIQAKDVAGNTSPFSPPDSFSIVVNIDTNTIQIGDGADTLHYDNLDGDSMLSADSDQLFSATVYNAETVTLYYTENGNTASSDDTAVLLQSTDSNWSGTISEANITNQDTINFILEGINTAGDTDVEDSGGNGFKYQLNDASEVLKRFQNKATNSRLWGQIHRRSNSSSTPRPTGDSRRIPSLPATASLIRSSALATAAELKA